MTQSLQDGAILWRVNYGPKDYVNQRGGDVIIDVDTVGKIERVLLGQ